MFVIHVMRFLFFLWNLVANVYHSDVYCLSLLMFELKKKCLSPKKSFNCTKGEVTVSS